MVSPKTVRLLKSAQDATISLDERCAGREGGLEVGMGTLVGTGEL
jgi:hypothetical protein